MNTDGVFDDEDFDRHWHLFPGDFVRVDDITTTIEEAGIYRVNRDGTLEDWGPVVPEEQCAVCARLGLDVPAPTPTTVSRDGVAVRHNSGGNTFGTDKPKPPLPDMGYGRPSEEEPA